MKNTYHVENGTVRAEEGDYIVYYFGLAPRAERHPSAPANARYRIINGRLVKLM